MGKKLKKEYRFYKKRPKRKRGVNLSGILITLLGIFVFVYGFSFVKRLGQKEIKTEIEPKDIRIQILNGSGIKGACRKVSEFLNENRSKNLVFYVVNEVDFSDSFVFQTILLDRSGNKELIGQIAEILGLKKNNVFFKPLKDNFLDLDATLVLGSDFKKILKKAEGKMEN